MADKVGKASVQGNKPVPMRLFATWEVDKSSPSCIPRLCSLTLTRLLILKMLEQESTSVIIAVKMQSSKRILRSNEISLPPTGLLDTELDMSFSLQYPHFLKRDGNKLQVMIQRRNKYKNRTMLGYKTLATGYISMAQVLQQSVDRQLSLYSEGKEHNSKVAQVSMLALSSQPVDHDDSNANKMAAHEDVDLSDDDEAEDWSNDEMSDSEPTPEDEGGHARPRKHRNSRGSLANRAGFAQFRQQRNIKQKFVSLLKRFKVSEEADSEQDPDAERAQEIADLFDELEDLSDSGPEMDNISVLSTPKPKLRPFFSGKSNPLLHGDGDSNKDNLRYGDDALRRSNDSDSHQESSDHETFEPIKPNGTQQPVSAPPTPKTSVSSKGPPTPKTSVSSKTPSTPKMSSSKAAPVSNKSAAISAAQAVSSLVPDIDSYNVGQGVGPVISSPRCSSLREKKPRKVLLDQLSVVLSSDDSLPDSFILVNTNEWQGQMLSQLLKEPQHRVISTCSSADVKATISFIVNKIQKFCNTNSKAPDPIKIAVAGGDSYFNLVLRPYVEQFSAKSHDWQNYIKFLFIPLGSSSLGKFLGSFDTTYSNLFLDTLWKDSFEKADNATSDSAEISNRITHYLSEANSVLQLPIAEAMVTYKGKGTDEDSSQIFLPFVIEVRMGPTDASTVCSSIDYDDAMLPTQCTLSGSPPTSSSSIPLDKMSHITPPSSPNVNSPLPITSTQSSGGNSLMSPSSTISPMNTNLPPCNFMELLDLQLDYWTTQAPMKSDVSDKGLRKESKASLKTSFKSVQVSRLTPPMAMPMNMDIGCGLTLSVVTKEKKQKIMRLGKKSKDVESKIQNVDNISRLICTSKSQNHPFTVYIDSTELASVKFFQLSSQWQTHVKFLPVLLFNSCVSEI